MLLAEFRTVKNGKGWLEIYRTIDTSLPKCRVIGFRYHFNVVRERIVQVDEDGNACERPEVAPLPE